MKKYFFIICSYIFFIGCEDVVDINVPTQEPRLVIDANFNIFLNQPNRNLNNFIKLTLSTPFFETEIPAVSNATVFMTDIDNGTVFNFRELNTSGIYVPQESIIPELNATYELSVIYNNETYNATATLTPSVPIDNIEQGEGSLFDNDETEIIVSFTDDSTRDDYYLFDLDFGLFLTTEDEFYQGEQFIFSYFYENIIKNQDIDVIISGVDEQFYNYLTLTIEQNGQNGGGPFQTTPATIRGNIVNTTNPDNYPLGYFSISEANHFGTTIN